MIFWDTSALLKAYIPEPGSSTVKTILKRMDGRLLLTTHVALEVLAGLSKALRSGILTPELHQQGRSEFLRRYAHNFRVVDLPGAAVWHAFSLTSTYRQVSVGAMDLLHVASALELRARNREPFIIACSDRALTAVARASGLTTFDPETESLEVLLAFYRRASRN